MKILLTELRSLIREELSLALNENEDDDLDQAMELARTPEYATPDTLAEYLMDDDRMEYTHIDLRALGLRTRQPLAALRSQLESYGLKLATREPPKRTRGFTTSSNDRWYGPGSIKSHGGSGIDTSTGRATVRGKTV